MKRILYVLAALLAVFGGAQNPPGVSRPVAEAIARAAASRLTPGIVRSPRSGFETQTPVLTVSTTDATAIGSAVTYNTWVNGSTTAVPFSAEFPGSPGPSPYFRHANGGRVRQASATFPGQNEVAGSQITDGAGNKSGNTVTEWETDAPLQEIVLRHGGGATGVAFAARVYIDGVPTSPEPVSVDYATAGTARYLTVDWSAQPAPRRMRAYRVETMGATRFAGIRCTAGDSVAPGVPSGAPTVNVLTDSLGEGAVAASYTIVVGGPSAMSQSVIGVAMSRLGYDPVISGSGGTGYLNPNAGAGRAKLLDRMMAGDLVADADLVIIAMGVNDTAGYATADIVAEAVRCWAYVRANAPRARLVVIGPWAVTATQTAAWIALNDALRAAAAANGVPYVDCRGWVRSGNTGNVTAADNGHPTRLGHDYLAAWIAWSVRRALGFR